MVFLKKNLSKMWGFDFEKKLLKHTSKKIQN